MTVLIFSEGGGGGGGGDLDHQCQTVHLEMMHQVLFHLLKYILDQPLSKYI